jgi:hypothetical protein
MLLAPYMSSNGTKEARTPGVITDPPFLITFPFPQTPQGAAYIFERDHGGLNEWGQVVKLRGSDSRRFPGSVSIDGNLAVLQGLELRTGEWHARAYAFGRNQGGFNAWGEVNRLQSRYELDGFGASISISRDTILISAPGDDEAAEGAGAAYVFALDIDGDGVRDGIDTCPRDPLNNVEGGCTRNSAAYLVLDGLITLGDVTTETQGTEFHVTATFTNTSTTPIGNPFFEVTELTGGNLLVNADAGPGGTGATLSPDVGDGILSPGESTTTTFVIALETPEAFRFYVSVRGEASL